MNFESDMINSDLEQKCSELKNAKVSADEEMGSGKTIETKETKETKANKPTLWNILPSYEMQQAVGRDNSSLNRLESLPPSYEDSSSESVSFSAMSNNVSTNSTFSQTAESSDYGSLDRRLVIADQNTTAWETTVMNNVDKLTNLTSTNTEVSDALKIEIKFTKEIGEMGKEPEYVDPNEFEFKEGDSIYGHVLISNESSEPIPFEGFYVVFEGSIKTFDEKNMKSLKLKDSKIFLEMYDLSASWQEVHVVRLTSDNMHHKSCPFTRDSFDGSLLYFRGKTVLPGTLYKRYFTFTIPSRLLDTECTDNHLQHYQLPPTMGRPRVEGYTQKVSPNLVKRRDFAYLATSIGYGIQALFIGKKSNYKADYSNIEGSNTLLINEQGDEFVILKELYKSINIVPRRFSEAFKDFNQKLTRLSYESFIKEIEDTISEGKFLNSTHANLSPSSSNLLTALSSSSSSEDTKQSQLYIKPCDSARKNISKLEESKLENFKEIYLYYDNQKVFGKSEGTLRLSFPEKEYILEYLPPYDIRKEKTLSSCDFDSWKIDVSFNLDYYMPKLRINDKIYTKAPQIKDVNVELIVDTFKSSDGPIPIEIFSDLLFRNEYKTLLSNEAQDPDCFSNIVQAKMKKYSSDLYSLLRKLGHDKFKVKQKLIKDLKTICQLKENKIRLRAKDVKVRFNGSEKMIPKAKISSMQNKEIWKYNSSSDDVKYSNFETKLNLHVDLKSIGLYGTEDNIDKICLPPNFQSCYLCRFYYLRVTVALSNRYVQFKLPVTIERTI